MDSRLRLLIGMLKSRFALKIYEPCELELGWLGLGLERKGWIFMVVCWCFVD